MAASSAFNSVNVLVWPVAVKEISVLTHKIKGMIKFLFILIEFSFQTIAVSLAGGDRWAGQANTPIFLFIFTEALRSLLPNTTSDGKAAHLPFDSIDKRPIFG